MEVPYWPSASFCGDGTWVDVAAAVTYIAARNQFSAASRRSRFTVPRQLPKNWMTCHAMLA
jgi:hypothetical protein